MPVKDYSALVPLFINQDKETVKNIVMLIAFEMYFKYTHLNGSSEAASCPDLVPAPENPGGPKITHRVALSQCFIKCHCLLLLLLKKVLQGSVLPEEQQCQYQVRQEKGK